ncbi:hypothetical protein [Nocardiopsis sp. CNT312]|uniref:hypothetical protein n=1 Tax=Nocardiopsis sp. CNT312 TaxID=1137268 RepID=UPI00048C0059|nr:hypothetical protein [Nocardiopsis sp. CNT312]
MTTSLDDAALTAFLEGQETSWLAEQLIMAADDDPLTRIRLCAAAGAESAADEARTALLDLVADHVPSLVDEDPAEGEELHRAIDLLDDLVEYGFEDEAARIAAEALADYLTQHGDDEGEYLDRLREAAGED